MNMSPFVGATVTADITGNKEVLVISGSPSAQSKTALLGAHMEQVFLGQGISANHLSVRDLPAEALMKADFADPTIAQALEAVGRADGIVLATPTYKAAYSGLLKTFLDLLPQFGLAGKAVLPIATGGSIAHVLALDYALRPVLHSMGARHVVQSYFVLDRYLTRHDTGELTIEPEIKPALDRVIAEFTGALAVHLEPVSFQP